MTRSMLIRARESCLIVIDMQERLVPAMQAPARTIRNAKILVTAAKRLGIPVLLTEQYPKGLGHTVSDLAKVADGLMVLEKLHFSCMEDKDFAAAFRALGRRHHRRPAGDVPRLRRRSRTSDRAEPRIRHRSRACDAPVRRAADCRRLAAFVVE